MAKKVVIGMSGGVDSAVAAVLLKEQGYEVVGITMKLWEGDSDREDGCCSVNTANDARRVCDLLDIPFYVSNFKEAFKEKVIDYFVDEYFKGRTPNPCIECNRHLKFNDLLKLANNIEAEYIATGHYAKVEYDEKSGRYLLKKSVTAKKDQTYVLYCLTQEQLSHIVMPLGNYTKEEVRAIAAKAELRVANKPESQEICFVEDNDYGRFLAEVRGKDIKQGTFVDKTGRRLGIHKGIVHYTIGQRKGLGYTFGKPVFVTKIDPEKNLVTLGDHEELMHKELYAEKMNFISLEKLEGEMRVTAKIRYSAKEAPALILPEKDGVRVIFDEPQRAITPGQAVVFYDGEVVVGGGTIIYSEN